MTFTYLKNSGFLDLHVFATDLNEKQLKRFSFADSPDIIVAEAIRASISIPLFFKAWKFTNNKPDNHIYVDGGMIYNFPMTAFDLNGKDNVETIGFFLDDINGNSQINNLDYNHPIDYIKILFETLMDAQNINTKSDTEEESRTITIDDFGISSTNFNISDEDKNKLFNSGKKYTNDYLKKIGLI
jgi:NTE family protein